VIEGSRARKGCPKVSLATTSPTLHLSDALARWMKGLRFQIERGKSRPRLEYRGGTGLKRRGKPLAHS
jgi:hypothetical protein